MDDEEQKGRQYLLVLHVQRNESDDPTLDVHRLKAWYETQQSSWDKTGMFTMKRIIIIPVEE